MRRIFSARVRITLGVLLLLLVWIQVFEPDPVRPTNLLQTIPAAVSEIAIQAGGHRAVYRAAKDRFVLAGPPEALADEARRASVAEEREKGPNFSGLTDDKRASEWRGLRLSELLVHALSAIRGGRVVRLPEPGAADRAAYGVEKGEIVVKLNAGREYEVRVGGTVPGGHARYFHCPQEKIWGLLPGDVVGRLERLASRDLPEE